jgi:small conductance mechanosensitive channel
MNAAMNAKDITLDFVIRYGFQVVGAAIILIVGFLLARWIANLADRGLQNRIKEPPMRLMIVRIVRLLILALVLIAVIEKLGFEITPLVAVIGIAGVGVGFAFHGVLSSLVAGLSILFTRHYRVGDYIELLGVHGQVLAIELFATTLEQLDRSRVIIPNQKIVGEILHNYGTIRQLDMKVGVAYGTNLEEALRVAKQVVAADPRVLKEPAAVIGVSELADSSVTLSIRPWVMISDMIAARGELYQSIVARFRTNKIDIPFPTREVRMAANS